MCCVELFVLLFRRKILKAALDANIPKPPACQQHNTPLCAKVKEYLTFGPAPHECQQPYFERSDFLCSKDNDERELCSDKIA